MSFSEKNCPNIATEWRTKLDSSVKADRVEVLMEILTVLNCRDESLINQENFRMFLIQSEICSKLCEMITNRSKVEIRAINKIVCCLSECDSFFKTDFYKVTRAYMRMINSFPEKDKTLADHHKNVVSTAMILLKRAREREVGFSQTNDFPASSLLFSACSANAALGGGSVLALDYVALILDITSSIELDEKGKLFQCETIVTILRSLKFNRSVLENEIYFNFATDVLFKVLNIVPAEIKWQQEELFSTVFIEKILEKLEFILNDNSSFINYECFCNFLYCVFKSKNISFNKKLLIANRFLILNGFQKLSDMIREHSANEFVDFKSRVVLAEVMLHLTIVFHNDSYDKLRNGLRPKFLDIAFDADINFKHNSKDKGQLEPSGNTITFLVIKHYIVSSWKIKSVKNDVNKTTELMAYLLDIMKRQKLKIDNGIFSMLISVFTVGYVNSSIRENQILQSSSSTVMKYYKRHNVIIDLDFIQWWHIKAMTYMTPEYEALVLQFLKTSKDKVNLLSTNDLFVFDQKYLIKVLQDENTNGILFHNSAKVIENFTLTMREVEKILNLCENEFPRRDRDKLVYLMRILCKNASHITPKFIRIILKQTSRLLDSLPESLIERSTAIRLSVLTMTSKRSSYLTVESSSVNVQQ